MGVAGEFLARRRPATSGEGVYVREAHPGERAYREYSQHQDFKQKLSYARELVAKEHLTCPVLVDGMDEEVHRHYGSLPNMIYVIDKAENIAYKATWTVAEEVDQVLAGIIKLSGSRNSTGSSVRWWRVPAEICARSDIAGRASRCSST